MMLKNEWEEYRKEMINTPYTPRAAHSYEAWLEFEVSNARFSVRLQKEKENKKMLDVNKQNSWGDKLLTLSINIVGRVIEVWVALMILNWLGLIPQ
ncbi:hypothetical protein LCGC14_0593450 [marine sediment metagenome]|uniref:Uncharacterized protein n=1 Tax=marine sediment metagenome TaxID=412755 RepID=A0A0F9RWP9_9ZZZZ